MNTPSLWRFWCRQWRRHQDRRGKCQPCRSAWPCHSWPVYDGMIAEAVTQHERFVEALAAGSGRIPATFDDAEVARAMDAVEAWCATTPAVTVLVPVPRTASVVEGAA